jgi:hypothetical protein
VAMAASPSLFCFAADGQEVSGIGSSCMRLSLSRMKFALFVDRTKLRGQRICCPVF